MNMNGLIVYRHGNDGLADEASMETSIEFDAGEDMTVQSGREDADINTIVRRFGLTGKMPESAVGATYGDFSGEFDFQLALNRVIEAQDQFGALPAEVRSRFSNDPGRLLEFLNDDGNREEARKLGLLAPEPAPVEPMAVRVVSDPSSANGGSGEPPAP